MEGQYIPLPEAYQFSSRPRKSNCVCFLLFLISLLLFAGTLIAGLYWDGLSYILPYDAEGNACGSRAVSAFPYLYFVLPGDDLRYSVCVSECPVSEGLTCKENEYVAQSGGEFAYHYERLDGTVAAYSTTPIWGSLCYPNSAKRQELAGSSAILSWLMKIEPPHSVLEVVLALMSNLLVWVLPLALCVCFFFTLRFLVNVVTGLVLLAVFALIFSVGWTTYNSSAAASQGYTVAGAAGILLFVLSGVFLVCAVLLCKQVELTGVVLKLACSFLYSQFSMVVVGAVAYVLIVGSLAASSMVAAMTYYSGDPLKVGMQLFVPVMEIDLKTTLMLIFEVQFALWLLFFVLYFALLVFAHGVVKWYYEGSNVIPLLQFLPSSLRTLPYIDPIAYGSLVQSISLPLCLGIGGLLYYGSEAMEGLQCKFAVQMLLAVLWVFAAGLVELTRFAMINIMTTDNSFPNAISSAFLLFAANPLRFVAYITIIRGLFVLSWFFITYFSVSILNFLVGTMEAPTLASLISIFSIAGSVLTVLEVFRSVADTVFMCFLQDAENRLVDISGRPLLAKDTLETYHSERLS